MTELDDAIDVSNWQGDLADEIELCKREGIERVIVRLSLESEWHRNLAIHQLRQVAAADLEVDGYIWVYWDWSPEDTVRAALSLVESAGVTLAGLWFDCEDGRPGRAVVEDWLSRALATGAALGAPPMGIYTARWWWTEVWGAGNSDVFSYLPLWRADYDGKQELEAPGFGGWALDTGHQYEGDPLDRNVFAKRLPGGPSADLEKRVEGLSTALAHLVDVVMAPLAKKRISVAQRHAILAEGQRIREQFLGPRP